MSSTPALSANAASPHVARTLRVDAITKRFGGIRVFEDVSFEVPAGEVLGVIGPNGAGKTTLINVMSGVLRPTSGHIRLGNQEVTGKPFYSINRLGIGRSFQQTNTFRSATVDENLSRAQRFAAAKIGPDLGIDDLIEEFGLAPHRHEVSEKLPYGLQKMLGLVMVLASRPGFLLLDEPAAGLERRERPQVDRFIEHARNTLGCGVLIVEHDMDMVRRLCPRIVVLEAGRLLAEGEPDEVLSRRDVIEAYLGASED
ncbi:ABC transporter ATP-binding protein [Burkholderia sp. Bp9143]|uniref:ABC transporter ATP-binding protein n=1 Tax=Burkholderia sp. Bp9143 TaxID=2184574 RepID=UPI000F596803|nr:ABC transporter ATP-binding protein [Burkholderia sp. Bp9143]RQR21465.1 ABC transporter ATP-binding protein [Burkholderia sp. Bp9143]